MSLSNLSVPDDVEAPSTDNLGEGYKVKTGLYKMLIDVAYSTKSAGGATGIVLHFKSVDPGEKAQLRQTLWVVSKAGKPYYLGGKNKDKKILLPDMQLFTQICKICVPGTDPDKLVEEKKTIKVWNNEMRAEVPTEVDYLSELKGKALYAGIVAIRKNKEALNPDTGKYEATPEEQNFSQLHRVFHTDGFSTEEKDAGAEKPLFVTTWKTKHTSDYVDDTFKEITGSPAAGSASASAVAAAAAVDDNLFDD